MYEDRFQRLLRRCLISGEELRRVLEDSAVSGRYPEDVLLERGVPRYELLLSLSEAYHVPFVEYSEDLIISRDLIRRLDMQRLKRSLWLPLSVSGTRAEVIACRPDDGQLGKDIRTELGVADIDFRAALPSDIVRIIENNQDINPLFPQAAGRTPLAKVRTFLAERRSAFACHRTSLARGRTGLAFLRTGISLITIAMVILRVFAFHLAAIAAAAIVGAAGVVMASDGLLWYLPARKASRMKRDFPVTEPTCGSTVLEARNPGDAPDFIRTDPVEGAEGLREGWSSLSPVMRRRFLAGDRTDFAEERTLLAHYRTVMALSRTGLAFTRTGIAFAGLGLGLLRQFGRGPWSAFDALLLAAGIGMVLEGFHWYLPGRVAGKEGLKSVSKADGGWRIWDFAFPPVVETASVRCALPPPLRPSYAPGIWATTGVALERTLLADRRNVMARLRTIMARSRTGLSLIRTGVSVTAVGLGLLVYFGTGSAAWAAFDGVLIAAGVLLLADGLLWHIPAERERRRFPYCFGDMEIVIPDYGKPARKWGRAVFSHDDI